MATIASNKPYVDSLTADLDSKINDINSVLYDIVYSSGTTLTIQTKCTFAFELFDEIASSGIDNASLDTESIRTIASMFNDVDNQCALQVVVL